MSRERYRQAIHILRRSATGEYFVHHCTSCEVRDEKWSESQQEQSGRIEDVKIFCMRAQKIESDDLIRWKGEVYRVEYVDAYDNRGREIRVRAMRSRSRYSVRG